ncbi:MAG: ferredoxin reductase family protein [Ferrimicrobium sp.]
MIGIGMGVTLGLPLVDGTLSEIHIVGGLVLFLGSITGLVGTYLALVMVVLASRLPALERSVGHVRVIRWHRVLAPWPISLIIAHVVFTTLAYADSAHNGVVAEFGILVNTFPYMVTATVALAIMVIVGLISFKRIRSRIPREQWWLLHLLLYAAIVLSFAHEVVLGPSFVHHPLAQGFWIAVWLLAAVLIVIFRIAIPLSRSSRHRLRVVEVLPEGVGVVSIILSGRQLDRLSIEGGQFFEWRFLTRRLWWQAHPFTVSAIPQAPYVRMTVRDSGDFSAMLRTIPIGTRVAIEGPYGVFTKRSRRRRLAVIIAGGIGITAARALLEDLSDDTEPAVILRASKLEDLPLLDEVEHLVQSRKGVVHRLIGSRDLVDLACVSQIVPDLAQRDVFICGSEEFVAAMVGVATAAGVPSAALHHEAYSF